jgi:LmbE family N-acetylglucosaminyl deacetylase
LVGNGAAVVYVICSDGCQGGEDPAVPDAELSARRYSEQRVAAEVLGVQDVVFLGFRDGSLAPTVELRKAITREVRRFKPELVLTHSPSRNSGIAIGTSHPDHHAVGEATLCVVYPDARNPRCYPELLAEGFEPHKVKEVWMPSFDGADHFVDVSQYVDKKIEAILCHQSQLRPRPDRDPEGSGKWIRERLQRIGEKAGYEYAESFRRIQTG